MYARPDLLVIGGGMAGLTAAAWVVQHGGSAVVVERAAELGGSARYASYLHTATAAHELREADPGSQAGVATATGRRFRRGDGVGRFARR